MSIAGDGLVIIGENFNATRKIKITSPKVIQQDGKVGIGYTDLDGNKRVLDVTGTIPEDANKRLGFNIPHVAEACRQKDMNYMALTSLTCVWTKCLFTQRKEKNGCGGWFKPPKALQTLFWQLIRPTLKPSEQG